MKQTKLPQQNENKDCDKWISDRKYFVLHLNSILKVKNDEK